MPIDRSQYLTLFTLEGTEHAEGLEHELRRSQAGPPPREAIDAMFRHAHSIKGMAASMEFPEIVELAHAVEEVIGALRLRQGAAVPPEAIDLALEAADRLSAMVHARGEKRPGDPATDLAQRLRNFASAPLPVERSTSEPAVVASAEPDSGAGLQKRLRAIRVKAELLDDLLDVAGELLLENDRMREFARGVGQPLRGSFEEVLDRMHGMVRSLHQRIVTVRLTPLSLLTDQLPRHLRELCHRIGKEVDLSIQGAEVEIDRAIVEELAEVLVHLLRNCVDHGIEPPELREALGKTRRGKISVNAQRDRDRLIVDLMDDGRGFDLARIRAAVLAAGLLGEAEAASLTEAEVLQFASRPGISTAPTVTDLSGRGVGLDAVRNSLEGLGGTLEITSSPGRGSRFRLRLPLAVALVQVLLAEVDREIVAVPISKVLGVVDLLDDLSGGAPGAPRRHLTLNGTTMPLFHLGRLLGWRGLGSDDGEWVGTQPVLLVDSDGQTVGLKVDRLVGQQEVVLKPLAAQLAQIRGLSAMTLLGTGRPVFVLDVPRLLDIGFLQS